MYGYLLSKLELLYQEVNGIIVEAQNVPDPEKSCILFFRTVVMFPNTYLAFQILADNFKTLIWQINYWPSLKKSRQSTATVHKISKNNRKANGWSTISIWLHHMKCIKDDKEDSQS